jgi:hypothetical protein
MSVLRRLWIRDMRLHEARILPIMGRSLRMTVPEQRLLEIEV